MERFDPRNLRRTILRMAYNGQAVHVPCAFSLVEILSVLYRSHVCLGDGTPTSPDRDYLILSKGHGVMAQYACLHELGWLAEESIRDYFQDGTPLKGLADAHVPGLDVSSGSLGHGLSVGVGLALAAQRNKTGQRVFVIVGDGELNEGSVWEAFLFAAHHRLANLCVIVDANGWQAMGPTDSVLALGPLYDKLTGFGLITHEVDGHDPAAIDSLLSLLTDNPEPRPRALIAHTVKGKGVSFMENDNRWHYTRLTAATYQQALRELESESVGPVRTPRREKAALRNAS